MSERAMCRIPTKVASLLFTIAMGSAVMRLLGACSTDDAPPSASSEPSTLSCTDQDGDGFGVGCVAGNDCDDTNPSETNACYVCNGSPSPGCGCSVEGSRAKCGVVEQRIGSAVRCGIGVTVCSSGTWGDCVLNTAEVPLAIDLQALGTTSAKCTSNVCDPYCQEYHDTPDPSMSNDAGISASEAGITLSGAAVPWEGGVDGGMSPQVAAILNDAGQMPDGGVFYHELEPGTSSPPDDFQIAAAIKYIDVYFLLDTSATMGPALSALGGAIAGAGGIIPSVRTNFPNARFGVGHFHAYQVAPHDTNAGPFAAVPWIGGGTRAVFPLLHSLNVQSSDTAAQDVVNWLGSGGTTGNNDNTEGANVALFAEASQYGLWAQDGAGTNWGIGWAGLRNNPYWVNPRNASGSYGWITDYVGVAGGKPALPVGTSVSGPCPKSTDVGFPCFDSISTPITVIMTDNPGEQGPGGIFSQAHGSSETVYSSLGQTPGVSPWPNATDVGTSNGTETNAVTIDPTRFQRFKGNLNGNGSGATGTKDMNGGAGQDCASGCFMNTVSSSFFPTLVPGEANPARCSGAGGNGREAYFKFSVPAGLPGDGLFVHFDTLGSERDLALYIIDTATRKRVACGDSQYNFTPSAVTFPMMKEQATIEARLGPGDYVLVVDEEAAPLGGYGGNSRFFLQVNAAPDGWSSGAPAGAGSYPDPKTTAPYPPANFDPRYVAVPSFDQVIAAQRNIGGRIIGIDASGIGAINSTGTDFVGCTNGGGANAAKTSAIDRFGFISLQEAARQTGSIDGTNSNYWTNPFVFPLAGDGQVCNPTDPTLATQVVNAISTLTTTLRQDVTVFARDTDDATDFDGTGGPQQLTPANIDEGPRTGYPHGYFIQAVEAQVYTNGTNGSHDTYLGQPRCSGGIVDYKDPVTGATLSTNSVLKGCLPDTQVLFKVRFAVPAAVTKQVQPQIFKFDAEVRDLVGASVLASKPAIVVVPSDATSYQTSTWSRDYDVSSACPSGTHAVWGLWSWNSLVPGGSGIDFSVQTADSLAGLSSAPSDSLQFTNPPGPLAKVGMPVGVDSSTASGSADVATTLGLNGRVLIHPFLRVNATLKPSVDKLYAPTLQTWNLQISCPPTE